MLTQLRIAGLVLAVTACGGAASSGALARACVAIGDMTDEICDCIASQADERLTAEGRAFVLAVLEDDEVEATKLREGLPIEEAMTAGMFMAQAPLECGAEDDDN